MSVKFDFVEFEWVLQFHSHQFQQVKQPLNQLHSKKIHKLEHHDNQDKILYYFVLHQSIFTHQQHPPFVDTRHFQKNPLFIRKDYQYKWK